MTQTLDLGPRVELISMDPHFHDITIALYSPGSDGQPAYLVHTYSSIPGADERLAVGHCVVLVATPEGGRTAVLDALVRTAPSRDLVRCLRDTLEDTVQTGYRGLIACSINAVIQTSSLLGEETPPMAPNQNPLSGRARLTTR